MQCCYYSTRIGHWHGKKAIEVVTIYELETEEEAKNCYTLAAQITSQINEAVRQNNIKNKQITRRIKL